MTEPLLPLVFLAGVFLFALLSISKPRRRRRWRPRPAPPAAAPNVEAILSCLHALPFDRMCPQEQAELVERLRAADQARISPKDHARIHLALGEIALLGGDRELATERFRTALRWDPRLPIRRTLERLETPTVLAFTARRAA